jgi:hypothetical protein
MIGVSAAEDQGSISPTFWRKAQMRQWSFFGTNSHSFAPFSFTTKIMPN